MNYRHIYHAGHICDVVKHSVLALLIEYMKQKDKAFAVLDTHAGCGLYDLSDERAQKTMEYEVGVARLWDALCAQTDQAMPDVLAPYLSLLKSLNGDDTLRYYPGSPIVVRNLLRAQDRLMACELHPEDVHALRRALGHDKQVQVHHRDAYEALRALLPMPEKRGLILIDPPFETPDEFGALIEALGTIKERMPQAVTAIWYPIKERPTIWKFHERLIECGFDKALIAEFIFQPEVRGDRLNGTGFAFLNPPWTLEAQLGELFPLLHELMQTEVKEHTIKALS